MNDPALHRRAVEWFEEHTQYRAEGTDSGFDVSVFHALTEPEEREMLHALQQWHQAKWDAGLAGLEWGPEYGGAGLGRQAADLVRRAERDFLTPPHHELFDVTVHLCAPTVNKYGTDEQRHRYVRSFARAEELCVQLFSEPGAGSDLASLATRARWTDGRWLITGQKVWSSGAHFADHGLLLARTDDTAVKHAGITAFLLPLDSPGVTVRPLRQMSGGASFCEVFLDEVDVPDSQRLGDVGAGWGVATTTLGFERDMSGGDTHTGGSWEQVLETARALGRDSDPLVRVGLADVYIDHRLAMVAAQKDLRSDEDVIRGPQGSVRKLQWVNRLGRMSQVVTRILEGHLAADTGTRATFEWNAHLLGAPGYRIAGGTDEIQRTIVAERVLGLPPSPKVDRGIPWKDVPR